jgi:hypothetical protein
MGGCSEVLGGPWLELTRAAWQAGHIRRVKRPSTWRNGPWSVPQKEQRDPPRLPLEQLFDHDSGIGR